MGSWTNFKYEEFKCKHCGENLMKEDFIDKLQVLRERVGFPLRIHSGYRCPVHNMAVSSTGWDGPHTTGRAVDIGVDREQAFIVLRELMAMNSFTGIGFQQKGAGGRFIHLDDLMPPDHSPRPTIWTY